MQNISISSTFGKLFYKVCKNPHPSNLVESFTIYQMATEEYLDVKTRPMVHLVTS